MNTINQHNILNFTRPNAQQPSAAQKLDSVQAESAPAIQPKQAPIQSSEQALKVLAQLKTAINKNPTQALAANNIVNPQFLRILT